MRCGFIWSSSRISYIGKKEENIKNINNKKFKKKWSQFKKEKRKRKKRVVDTKLGVSSIISEKNNNFLSLLKGNKKENARKK